MTPKQLLSKGVNLDAGVTLYLKKLLFWVIFSPKEQPGSDYECWRLFTFCILFEKEFYASGRNSELILLGLTSAGQKCYFNGVLDHLEIKGICLQMLNLCFDNINKTPILWISHLKFAESCLWPSYEPSKVTLLKRSIWGVISDTSEDVLYPRERWSDRHKIKKTNASIGC